MSADTVRALCVLVAWIMVIGAWLAVLSLRKENKDLRATNAELKGKAGPPHTEFDMVPIETGRTDVICTTCKTCIGSINDPAFFDDIAERHYRENKPMTDDDVEEDCKTPERQ